MRDQTSLTRLSALHPAARGIFQDFIEECENTLNITLRIMEPVFRTVADQDALYAQGRTAPGKIVTNAKGGSSFHNYGLAVDLCHLAGKEIDWNYDMSKLKPVAAKYGIEWGGDWVTLKDKPHFQKTFGYKWQELFAMFQAKNFDAKGYLHIKTDK